MTFKRDWHRSLCFIVFGALLLSIPAFSNKFPLVFSDTGAYLDSGFDVFTPYERPIYYGLFIRHISLASSLFLVVFAQSLIMSFLIFRTAGFFLEKQKTTIWFLPLIGLLLLTTAVAHFTSILIPDVFTSFLFLSSFLLIYPKNQRWPEKIFLIILLLFSLMVHYSNQPILILFIIFLALHKWITRHQFFAWKPILIISVVLISSFFVIPVGHYLADGKYQSNRLTHVVLMSRLIEFGILQDYLKKACEHEDYAICEYQDLLSTYTFIWDYDLSPVHKTGGWEKNRDEYNEIIGNILSDPSYYDILFQQIIETSMMQFVHFDVNHYYDLHESAPKYQIDRHLEFLKPKYFDASQNNHDFNPTVLNYIQYFAVFTSLIVVLMIIMNVFSTTPIFRCILFSLLAFLYINALICGVFSAVADRYQGRVVWMLVFFLSLVLMKRFLPESTKNEL